MLGVCIIFINSSELVVLSIASHFVAIIYYEIVLRREAKRKNKNFIGLTFLYFGWVMRPFFNIVLFRALVVSDKLKLPTVLFIASFIFVVFSTLYYQLDIVGR